MVLLLVSCKVKAKNALFVEGLSPSLYTIRDTRILENREKSAQISARNSRARIVEMKTQIVLN